MFSMRFPIVNTADVCKMKGLLYFPDTPFLSTKHRDWYRWYWMAKHSCTRDIFIGPPTILIITHLNTLSCISFCFQMNITTTFQLEHAWLLVVYTIGDRIVNNMFVTRLTYCPRFLGIKLTVYHLVWLKVGYKNLNVWGMINHRFS